jgi:hypothetical protein
MNRTNHKPKFRLISTLPPGEQAAAIEALRRRGALPGSVTAPLDPRAIPKLFCGHPPEAAVAVVDGGASKEGRTRVCAICSVPPLPWPDPPAQPTATQNWTQLPTGDRKP